MRASCVLVLLLASGCASDPLRRAIHVPFSVSDPEFERTASAVLTRPFIGGNRVTTLVNGDGYFPPMLDAVRGAERSITFEMYVFWGGEVASAFADAFCERAAAGVSVLVILDAIGVYGADALIERMKKAGVRVQLFHPPPWEDLSAVLSMNNRTHRRVLVVDGEVGFTGGAGIADEWAGNAEDPDSWRDTHFELRGPIVRQLQSSFSEHWLELTGELLEGDDFFPPLEPAGGSLAQVVNGDPGPLQTAARLGFLLAFAAAREELLIETPYFIPDDATIEALLDARRRGVAVRIIVPGSHHDVPLARAASRARWGELLAGGVELWEYERTMIHAKVVVVDRALVVLGSANVDPRSYHRNDELNLNVLDPVLARDNAVLFLQDLSRSRRVTYGEWRARPWRERLGERAASIFSPQL